MRFGTYSRRVRRLLNKYENTNEITTFSLSVFTALSFKMGQEKIRCFSRSLMNRPQMIFVHD
jgi:hypothetical protein